MDNPAPVDDSATAEADATADAESEAADTADDKAAASKAAADEPAASEPAADKGAASKAAADKAAAAEPAEKPAAAAEPAKATKPKAKVAKPKAVVDEPLMAELEKAPPPPEEPVMPTAREAAAARAQAGRRFEEPPPRMLRISFYFFLASGLVWLISMIASVILKQQLIDAEIERNENPDLTPEMIANGVTQILWIVLVASLTFTVFLGLFGYKATEGTRRARTLVTIFSVVLVLFHLLLNGTPAGILSAMFALVGLALLWSPTARAYFPPRQLR